MADGAYSVADVGGNYSLSKPNGEHWFMLVYRDGEWTADYPLEPERSKIPPIVIDKGHLYIIGADDGPVKIGSSRNLNARLRTLQTSHPYELKLLAVIEDGGHKEAAYHQQFAAHRLHGEWFERCPEIEAEIARLSSPSTGADHRAWR